MNAKHARATTMLAHAITMLRSMRSQVVSMPATEVYATAAPTIQRALTVKNVPLGSIVSQGLTLQAHQHALNVFALQVEPMQVFCRAAPTKPVDAAACPA
jgi:hypothetical protein